MISECSGKFLPVVLLANSLNLQLILGDLLSRVVVIVVFRIVFTLNQGQNPISTASHSYVRPEETKQRAMLAPSDKSDKAARNTGSFRQK